MTMTQKNDGTTVAPAAVQPAAPATQPAAAQPVKDDAAKVTTAEKK